MAITREELGRRWKEAQSYADWARPYILFCLLNEALDAESSVGYDRVRACYAPTHEQLAPTRQAMREVLSMVDVTIEDDVLTRIAEDWNVGIMDFSQCLGIYGVIPRYWETGLDRASLDAIHKQETGLIAHK